MKKIACFIDNINFCKALEKQAVKEGFAIEKVDSEFNIDHSHFMIITDDHEFARNFSSCGVPVAVVGERTKIAGAYTLSEPFDEIQFKSLVDFIFHGCSHAYFSNHFKPSYIDKKYTINNDIFKIDKIVYCITKDLIFFSSVSEIQKIRIGLSEMLTNAIEHGNLEISADEKFQHTEEGSYVEFVKNRVNDGKYSSRRVYLDLVINESEVCFTIKDEGEGFNVKETKFSTEGEDLLKLHGRGILITKMYFDNVEYNELGNKVTLRKNLK